MIEKKLNPINNKRGDSVNPPKISIKKNQVEVVIQQIKVSIENDNCMFLDRRDKYRNFLNEWLISRDECLEILKELTVENFSYVDFDLDKQLRNQMVYIFGKQVKLLKRYPVHEDDSFHTVNLYIKVKLIQENSSLVISFHEAEKMLKFLFL